MPNVLNQNGLTVKTLTEIVDSLVTGLQGIYGTDINVDSNSPDGQLINIFAQAVEDNLEVLVNVYDSFTVDGAFGVQLDERVALNGLFRQQGTSTVAQVAITVNQALNLYGLDQTAQPVFTVADNAGNQFQLTVTANIASPGTQTLAFRAANVGQVETTANTITNQVTVILGVTVVNNPSTASDVIGTNEETDAQLRIRHARSFALGATGPADAVEAALLNISGIADAVVIENATGSDVMYGSVNVTAHSIWAIVRPGTATDAQIGTAIYNKKAPGCGIVGSQSYVVARPNGTSFISKWDIGIAQALYIQFTIIPRGVGPTAFDTAAIATALAAALTYRLNQSASVGDFITAILTIAPSAIVSSPLVSGDNVTFLSIVSPTTPQHYFTVSAANIDISIL